MLDQFQFGYGSSVGGKSVFGAPDGWVRSKTGYGIRLTYNGGRPKDPNRFFAVIWQINVERRVAPTSPTRRRTVRLQLEAPRQNENPVLNQLKHDVIAALVRSELAQLAIESGYAVDDSRINTSDEQIKAKRTITVFKVLVEEGLGPEGTIEEVHSQIGWVIDAIVQGFDADLRQAFDATNRPLAKEIRKKREQEHQPQPFVPIARDGDKNAIYGELVQARKACRACQNSEDPDNDLVNASVIENGDYDCQHIGAFSQWQYNLDADLMIVAQDFGNVDWFVKEKGRPTSVNPSPTNRALIELLRCAGFHIKFAADTEAADKLFFTNAVLCLKKGANESPIKQPWLRNCGTRFLRPLIDLVQPTVVVALGTQAYQSVLTAYEMIPRVFRQAVDSEVPDILQNDVAVFPVYHCGWRGQAARSLDQQREDWKRIGSFLRQRLRG